MYAEVGNINSRKNCSPFSVKDILGLEEEENHEEELTRSSNEELKDDINDRGKKTRQCFTVKQVEELEKLFNEINYPDAYTRQMLAKKMNVSETRIQIWCQNRRAKIRRQRKQRKRIVPLSSDIHAFKYCPSINLWPHPLHPPLLPYHHTSEVPYKSSLKTYPPNERKTADHWNTVDPKYLNGYTKYI